MGEILKPIFVICIFAGILETVGIPIVDMFPILFVPIGFIVIGVIVGGVIGKFLK